MDIMQVTAWILVVWAVLLIVGSIVFHNHNRKK